jgi:hypothetical protein
VDFMLHMPPMKFQSLLTPARRGPKMEMWDLARVMGVDLGAVLSHSPWRRAGLALAVLETLGSRGGRLLEEARGAVRKLRDHFD